MMENKNSWLTLFLLLFISLGRWLLISHFRYESQVVGANFMLAFATVEEAMSWAARTQADHYYSGTRSSRSRGIAMGIW